MLFGLQQRIKRPSEIDIPPVLDDHTGLDQRFRGDCRLLFGPFQRLAVKILCPGWSLLIRNRPVFLDGQSILLISMTPFPYSLVLPYLAFLFHPDLSLLLILKEKCRDLSKDYFVSSFLMQCLKDFSL